MPDSRPLLILKKSREIPILAGHPWVFSGGVSRVEGARAGDVVAVMSGNGKTVGIATFHPGNTIRARMLAIGGDGKTAIDAGFFSRSFSRLRREKERFLPAGTTGFRLSHADADYLPGLIVDVYGDCVVFQIYTAAIDRVRGSVVEALTEVFPQAAIVERLDVESRRSEGLRMGTAHVHRGTVGDPVEFVESGITFLSDVIQGQKTGFYLDQREARELVRRWAGRMEVINLFCYSGALSVAAALAGARSVVSVDSSERALMVARETFGRNGIDPDDGRFAFVHADVDDYLGELRAERRTPGVGRLLVCDPPAFVKHRSEKEKGVVEYLKLNEGCFSALEEGDLFLTSSCSGMITAEEFLEIIRRSSGRAGRNAVVVSEHGQPHDHTRRASFPEGRYLKSYLLQIESGDTHHE